MTDIFFSYSSADRERVRPIHDALVAQGFEVFWDQQVPAGMDWDTWIRQHLTKSKCAMAFWSATSVSSDNVRHEATVAKQHGKLISVLLEPLTAEQFPMGLYVQQAANLSGWSGDYSHDEWRKFRREFEAKLTPLWVRRQIDELEAELVGERSRREGAERRDKVLQAQIAKEAEVQQYLKEERNIALDEVAALKATVEELIRARSEAEAKQAETQQGLKCQLDKSLDETKMLMATIEELNRAREEAEEREAGTQQELKREHDKAFDEAAALRATVEELTRARADAEARVAELSQHLRKVRQSKAQGIARSFLGVAIPLLVLAAAVATIGFWTLGISSRLVSPRGELSVEPRSLTFAVTVDRGYYKWEVNKKVTLRATGGPASWEAEGSQWLTVTPSKGQLADKESLEITVSPTAYPEKGKPVKGQVTFKNLDRSAKAAVVEVTGWGF
jgi:VIT1/CCC1 family predicted Fe2+/Mn2+ transporter